MPRKLTQAQAAQQQIRKELRALKAADTANHRAATRDLAAINRSLSALRKRTLTERDRINRRRAILEGRLNS